jgi:hypothetical protein
MHAVAAIAFGAHQRLVIKSHLPHQVQARPRHCELYTVKHSRIHVNSTDQLTETLMTTTRGRCQHSYRIRLIHLLSLASTQCARHHCILQRPNCHMVAWHGKTSTGSCIALCHTGGSARSRSTKQCYAASQQLLLGQTWQLCAAAQRMPAQPFITKQQRVSSETHDNTTWCSINRCGKTA